MKYKSNRNIVFSCSYHVVFCPKYRRPVLVDGVDERFKEIAWEVADELGFEIADARTDALHKVTTMLADENQVLCMEDLNSKGMMKNHHLAKAVTDASFGEFAQLLEYKCAERGRSLVKIGRFYPSSKTCSACGHRLDALPLSVRSWDCPACGAHHDRDVNAARNILTEGKRILSNTEGTAGHAGTVAAITA